ncbi:hypothetical protein MMC07_009147 [Pseudocyphellaria aurata]|nr:hypothetical protein [Pseudocyphellaria aurata]
MEKLFELTVKHVELHGKYQAIASKPKSVAEATTTTNYRAQGEKPTKLTGTNTAAYRMWRNAVKTKIEIDALLYPTKRSCIIYAFNQLTGAIFDAIETWVKERKEAGILTLNELFDEMEHYLGLPSLVEDAKRELLTITMASSELVDEYYHKLIKLWKYAETPEADRTKKFKSTLKPAIANPLLPMTYTNTREVLAAARSIENQKKERATYFLINIKPNKTRPWSGNKAGTSSFTGASTTGSGATESAPKEKEKPTGKDKSKERPNAKFPPTSTKPTGWVGTWHKPEQHPTKLDDARRTELQKQRQCWGCRGLGHRENDVCCPRYAKRANAIRAAEASNSDSENA